MQQKRPATASLGYPPNSTLSYQQDPAGSSLRRPGPAATKAPWNAPYLTGALAYVQRSNSSTIRPNCPLTEGRPTRGPNGNCPGDPPGADAGNRPQATTYLNAAPGNQINADHSKDRNSAETRTGCPDRSPQDRKPPRPRETASHGPKSIGFFVAPAGVAGALPQRGRKNGLTPKLPGGRKRDVPLASKT